jgi:hypothetical protein
MTSSSERTAQSQVTTAGRSVTKMAGKLAFTQPLISRQPVECGEKPRPDQTGGEFCSMMIIGSVPLNSSLKKHLLQLYKRRRLYVDLRTWIWSRILCLYECIG